MGPTQSRSMTRLPEEGATSKASEFADSLRKGVLLGAAVLVVALPPAGSLLPSSTRGPAPAAAAIAAAVAGAPPAAAANSVAAAAVPPAAARAAVIRRAEFGQEPASSQARQMANWIVHSSDHKNRSFVIVDKTDAKVFVFNPAGRLKAAAPALLGEAVGDDTVPGIGDKPLAQVLPHEKTTPAGRFIAEVGMSTRGEDVVWVDYDSAVSMHRVLKIDQRVQRLASPTPADNRMSFGCINVPPRFYEQVLRPAVDAGGAVIYVLPETRPLRQTFAAFYDVESKLNVANARR